MLMFYQNVLDMAVGGQIQVQRYTKETNCHWVKSKYLVVSYDNYPVALLIITIFGFGGN